MWGWVKGSKNNLSPQSTPGSRLCKCLHTTQGQRDTPLLPAAGPALTLKPLPSMCWNSLVRSFIIPASTRLLEHLLCAEHSSTQTQSGKHGRGAFVELTLHRAQRQ